MKLRFKKFVAWAAVVAQLVERSLPIPEVCGSNPVIGYLYITFMLSTLLKFWKDENKEKEAGNSQFFFKKTMRNYYLGIVSYAQNKVTNKPFPNKT